jgi:hypothetical protein
MSLVGVMFRGHVLKPDSGDADDVLTNEEQEELIRYAPLIHNSVQSRDLSELGDDGDVMTSTEQ